MMTDAEQAAVDYVAAKIENVDPLLIAVTLECAEFHFRHIPENQRQAAIVAAAAKVVARTINHGQ